MNMIENKLTISDLTVIYTQVNFTPALGNDCAADVTVKLPMLVDFLDLARQKMTICRPTTEHHKRNIALSKQNARKKEGLMLYYIFLYCQAIC